MSRLYNVFSVAIVLFSLPMATGQQSASGRAEVLIYVITRQDTSNHEEWKMQTLLSDGEADSSSIAEFNQFAQDIRNKITSKGINLMDIIEIHSMLCQTNRRSSMRDEGWKLLKEAAEALRNNVSSSELPEDGFYITEDGKTWVVTTCEFRAPDTDCDNIDKTEEILQETFEDFPSIDKEIPFGDILGVRIVIHQSKDGDRTTRKVLEQISTGPRVGETSYVLVIDPRYGLKEKSETAMVYVVPSQDKDLSHSLGTITVKVLK